jgi:hypothetical protein
VAAADEAGTLLRKILSPAEAQTLVQILTEPAPRTAARTGLAVYFAGASAAKPSSDAQQARGYLKVSSNGQVGYLPKANLSAARKIDANLKVLDEG